MIKLLRAAAFLLCMAVAAPVMAQNFDEGFAAFQAGDYATALQEWRPLAEQGHLSAQYNLGRMYDNGDGVTQDYAEAMIWYHRAAEQGYAQAQIDLGIMYNNGFSVTQDYAKAVNWYRRAAEQGDSMAQILLSAMYFAGRGVLQDAVLAHMWYNIGRANNEYQIGSGNRGRIEERMTREQIAEAQALARRCMASDYQDCD
jgi:TPR repeat protein